MAHIDEASTGKPTNQNSEFSYRSLIAQTGQIAAYIGGIKNIYIATSKMSNYVDEWKFKRDL